MALSKRSQLNRHIIIIAIIHSCYYTIHDILDIPDDKDDEENKNDADVFAKPTQSTYVAKSKHCDDHTSKQSTRTSVGKYIMITPEMYIDYLVINLKKARNFYCTLVWVNNTISHLWTDEKSSPRCNYNNYRDGHAKATVVPW